MTCVHHWMLESPHGEHSVTGECKYCHESRQFRSAEDTRWADWQLGSYDPRMSQLPGGGRRTVDRIEVDR